jgi:diguanylate cyclase (GGDEF)-like protein
MNMTNLFRGVDLNLGRIDRALRATIGSTLVYVGFINTAFVGQPVLAVLAGAFGAGNLYAALRGSCPVYRLAGINTRGITEDARGKARKLRAWLLVSFTGMALAVILVFGIAAYRIAAESGIKREAYLLRHVAEEEAEMLAADGTRSGRVDHHGVSHGGDGAHLAFVIDGGGRIVSGAPDADGKYARIIQSALSRGNDGLLESAGKSYLWVTAPIGQSGRNLIILHRLADDLASPFSTLGVGMIAAGGVILWLAIWSALILASVFMKRQKEHDATLTHQSLHDALTGLPNRELLRDRLHQAIALARRRRRGVALLVMDLDQFKEINNTLGHASGDEILKQMGARLCHALRASDTVARLGGDEFALLMPEGDARQAVQLANKVHKILEPPYHVNDMDIEVGPSIGIAAFPDHGASADEIMQRADVAMYQAKQKHSGHAVYEQETDAHSVRRLTLMSDLRHAIDNGELMLYYQPEIELRSGAVIGVEALARWRHPRDGFIPPDEFIPLAEKSGTIKALTEQVLQAALRQYHAWRRAGISLNISVNLSARNLHDPLLPDRLRQLLAAWDVPPGDIHLEITESAMMANPEKAGQILAEFDAMGVGLWIDDFGTGYSSLDYLKRLPVDAIKIDKSFVRDMTDDKHNAAIVRATVELAHNLGLKVVAEGVENEQTRAALRTLGCDFMQGYYISKPVPAEELARWLEQRDCWSGKSAVG